MNRVSKSLRALGFDRGTSLRHPRLRRGLGTAARIVMVSVLLGACGVAVFAAAGSNMMGGFVPGWITGNGHQPPTRPSNDPVPSTRYESPAVASGAEALHYEWTMDGVLRNFPDQLSTIVASADGTTVAAVGRDGSLELWARSDDDDGWSRVVAPAPEGRISSLAISRNGQTLAAGFTDGRVGVVRLGQDVRFRTVRSHRGPVSAVELHPAGTRLYSGGNDGFLRSIALPSMASPAENAVGEPIRQLIANAEAGFLSLLGGDGRVRMHSLLTLASLCPPGLSGTEQFALSADGRRLVCLMNDGSVRICRPGNLDQIAQIDSPNGPGSGWRTVGMLDENEIVLATGDELARVSLVDGKLVHRSRASLKLDWLIVEATMPAPKIVLPGGSWPEAGPLNARPMVAVWPGGLLARFSTVANAD